MTIKPGMFDGEVENKFELLPEGVYKGTVTNLEMRTSKNGNDYLNLEFTLENKRKVWDRLMWHTDKCIDVTKGKLEALGFTREERKKITSDKVMQDAVNYMVDGKIYNVHVGRKDDNNVVKYVTLNEEETGDAPW